MYAEPDATLPIQGQAKHFGNRVISNQCLSLWANQRRAAMPVPNKSQLAEWFPQFRTGSCLCKGT